MKKYLEVRADTNDADYITSRTEITDEQLERFKSLFEAIANFKSYKTKTKDREMDWTHRHNFPWGETCRQDLGEKTPEEIYVESGLVDADTFADFLEEFVPTNDYGIHTIDYIQVIVVESEEMIFKFDHKKV